jgi:hypothetical protein
VTALLKSKGSLEQLALVVAWDPAPVYVSGYTKLREGFAAAQAWQVCGHVLRVCTLVWTPEKAREAVE